MSGDYNTMSMLRLCSLDPAKYGWTACGGVAPVLEPHEMARRQEARERFLKRQREEAKTAKALASVAAAADNDNAAEKKDNIPAATAETAPKYYTITEPTAETIPPADSTENTASATDADTKNATETNDKKSAKPIKKISIHAASASNNLDIYTYHRGRVGQEPRNVKTGELLCDTDPVDTNHGWSPNKTLVAKVTIQFPIGDPNEEEYVDSDLDDDDDDDDDNETTLLLEEIERAENRRVSRSRLARSGSSVSPNTPTAASTGTPTVNDAQQQQAKMLPQFIEVIQWDLANPKTPTPEEYAANIASEFGLTFPQTMDLKESIERQLSSFARSQPQFYAPIAMVDPYGSERPNSHFGPPEIHCGPVLGAAANAAAANNKPTVVRRSGSSMSGGGGSSRKLNAVEAPSSTSRSAGVDRPRGAVKPDRNKIQVIPKNEIAKAGKGNVYAEEVICRAQSQSCSVVAECLVKGEHVLNIVHNEVCHICHNRKALGLTFHCGRHTYCDMHCGSRLSFRAQDYDSNNPTIIPIDHCPVCTLQCTCAKCTRRLDDVSRKMEAACEMQNCGVKEVVMDNLFDLCSAKLKGDRETANKPKKGVSSTNKKKTKKVKIEDDSSAVETTAPAVEGGIKRNRSDEGEVGLGSKQSSSRSTRSSPLMHESSSDARPKKKKKTELAVAVPVLKVSPSDFPKELYGTKDLDPSSANDLNKAFTPDGSFPVEADTDPASQMQSTKQKYQDKIEMLKTAEEQHHFYDSCAECGLPMESSATIVACTKCPRAYHKKCLEDTCSESAKNGSEQKVQCKRCELDQTITANEEITRLMLVNKKIKKAYSKYESSDGFSYSCILLTDLLQILAKLSSYDYGWIFVAPVDTAQVPNYLQVIRKPMDYGTITSKLEKCVYSPHPDKKGEMHAMEELILYALMDIHRVYHNCFLFNSKGTVYHRAAEVQEIKWNTYFKMHIEERLSENVQEALASFQKSCKDKQRKAACREAARLRVFQASNPESTRGKPLAIFDPDTKRIVKQYSSKTSAKIAVLMLHDAGYACERKLNPANAKSRLDAAEDPLKPLFGYQWVLTEKLKSGNFQVKPFFREDDLKSPTPNNIVILKEDTVSGGQQVRGFESEESAYQDWLSDKSVSFNELVDNGNGNDSSTGATCEINNFADFVKNYLDGDKSINGICWNRVKQTADCLAAAIPPKSPNKVVMEEELAPQTPKNGKDGDNNNNIVPARPESPEY